MKSNKTLLSPAVPIPPPLPGVGRRPRLTDASAQVSPSDKMAGRQSDPGHRFHPRDQTADTRPQVAASGAMVRVRARLPEFHKKTAGPTAPALTTSRSRKSNRVQVSKRRAGK